MLGYINFLKNKKLDRALPKGLLNAQALGTLKDYRYGLFSFGWCGCEIIAVYNFLQMLGRPMRLSVIAREIYRYGHVLLGFFGTNVYVLQHFLKKHRVNALHTTDKAVFLEHAPKGRCGLVSFWTGKVMRSSIHTVAYRIEPDGSVTVFNRYNKKDFDHRYADLREAFAAYPFITASWV